MGPAQLLGFQLEQSFCCPSDGLQFVRFHEAVRATTGEIVVTEDNRVFELENHFLKLDRTCFKDGGLV